VTILGALLLALVGSADLVRSAVRGPKSRIPLVSSIIAVWAGLVAVAAGGLGVPVLLASIPVGIAVLWLATTRTVLDEPPSGGIAPVLGLFLSLLGFLVWDRTALGLSGFVVEWHSDSTSLALRELPLPALLMGIGISVFLVESANIVVRASLRPTELNSADEPTIDVRAPRWWRAKPIAVSPTGVVDLRGGRLIGPLERFLIVGLTLVGYFPIVVGLIAAKGIVRFPEISNDVQGGAKAEYFLVGSLVSWTIAFASAGVLWLSAHS
jgi:hypothetical protein